MDPNRYKHPAILLADLRLALEPHLHAAGFVFNERNKPVKPLYLYIDYTRGDELFCVSLGRRNDPFFIGLTAEYMPGADEVVVVAKRDFSDLAEKTESEVQTEMAERLQRFVDEVTNFLAGLS